MNLSYDPGNWDLLINDLPDICAGPWFENKPLRVVVRELCNAARADGMVEGEEIGESTGHAEGYAEGYDAGCAEARDTLGDFL